MSDNESANLISEIQKLAGAIVEMSKKSSTKPETFNDHVKEYYGILKGVASKLEIQVNGSEDTITSIQTLTDQIVVKLNSGENLKLSNENLTNLLGFFKAYHAIIGDNIDEVSYVENEISEKVNENVTPNENPIKLMVDTNDSNNRIAMGFISETNPNDTQIFGESFVYNENYSGYKPHWFLTIPDSKNENMKSFFKK